MCLAWSMLWKAAGCGIVGSRTDPPRGKGYFCAGGYQGPKKKFPDLGPESLRHSPVTQNRKENLSLGFEGFRTSSIVKRSTIWTVWIVNENTKLTIWIGEEGERHQQSQKQQHQMPQQRNAHERKQPEDATLWRASRGVPVVIAVASADMDKSTSLLKL